MNRYAVAFIPPEGETRIRHAIVSAADEASALRDFFTIYAAGHYSNDERGFKYFLEDFSDQTSPSGSIINIPESIAAGLSV